jgi:hypothetical protein
MRIAPRDYETKPLDIVGPYVDPPERGGACVDEKTQVSRPIVTSRRCRSSTGI